MIHTQLVIICELGVFLCSYLLYLYWQLYSSGGKEAILQSLLLNYKQIILAECFWWGFQSAIIGLLEDL